MPQPMPTSFTVSTKRAFGALCYWDAWVESGRPGVILIRPALECPAR
jgi:hypothetical protein